MGVDSRVILENEICLVTGASRGIGRAIALGLGREGATVVGTATTEQGADGISELLGSEQVKGGGLALDVTDPEAVVLVTQQIVDTYGPVSVLVNNAGITRDNLLLRMKEEEWDAILDTNLKAAYRTSKACLKGMTRARHGRIINVSSVVGSIGNAGQSNYSAAKAGLVGFTKALAREVAPRNITVNAVAPGFIETDMTESLSDTQRTHLQAQIPLARLGTVEDVAEAVVFLASKRAAYITGATLHVNGGMFMN